MSARRLTGLVCSLVFLLGMFPATAAARGPQDEHARVLAHWTPERMASARARDFVRTADGRFQLAAGKPAPSAPATTGASWSSGGLILRASGRVYFNMGGGAWICSGSVATDSRTGVSLVLTAAHCAYDNANPAFATNWMFIPEFDANPTYDCDQTKWGCWTASALVVHNGYASAGGFNGQATLYDFAFAVVETGGRIGTELDTTVGRFPIAFSGVKSGSVMYAFGYPAGAPYDGRDLTYCSGKVSGDSWNLNRTWAMGCTMTGGSSGGPWLSKFSASNGSGTLGSVNSYTYSGVARMHGPKFSSTTQAVYSSANTATTNTIVR
jgi:hypothetical protein